MSIATDYFCVNCDEFAVVDVNGFKRKLDPRPPIPLLRRLFFPESGSEETLLTENVSSGTKIYYITMVHAQQAWQFSFNSQQLFTAGS